MSYSLLEIQNAAKIILETEKKLLKIGDYSLRDCLRICIKKNKLDVYGERSICYLWLAGITENDIIPQHIVDAYTVQDNFKQQISEKGLLAFPQE